MTRKNLYNQTVSKAQAGTDREELRSSAEPAALVEMSLGHSLDQATFASLRGIQVELCLTHSQLLESSRTVLGDKQFDAIFGDAGSHPEGLIDHKTFLSQAVKDIKS